MSSILRALKKLEKEMPSDVPASAEDAVHIDIRNTVRRRLWRGYLLQKFSLAASVCILFFLMFWLMQNKPILFNGFRPASQTPVQTVDSPGKPDARKQQAEENVSFLKDEGRLAALSKTPGEESVSHAGDKTARTAGEKKQTEILQEKSGEQALLASADSPVKTKKIVTPSAGATPKHQSRTLSAASSANKPESVAPSSALKSEESGGPDVSEGLTDVDLLLDVVEMPEVEEPSERKVTPEVVASAKPVHKRTRKAVSPVPKEQKAEKIQKKKIPAPETAAMEADEKPAYEPTPQDMAYQQLPERAETETGLEIQALVWAPEPEERFTVVNGDILKIGAFIDDVSVQYIGENFVVLQKKGTRWQQKMQVR